MRSRVTAFHCLLFQPYSKLLVHWSFAVFGPAPWNNLPPSLRAPELSPSTFERLLKTQLFRHAWTIVRRHCDWTASSAPHTNIRTHLNSTLYYGPIGLPRANVSELLQSFTGSKFFLSRCLPARNCFTHIASTNAVAAYKFVTVIYYMYLRKPLVHDVYTYALNIISDTEWLWMNIQPCRHLPDWTQHFLSRHDWSEPQRSRHVWSDTPLPPTWHNRQATVITWHVSFLCISSGYWTTGAGGVAGF